MSTQARVPRRYQTDGIKWLYDGKRKFLTDGFGLGKTSQAVWAAETPCLVLCPIHLLAHWRREILACRPDAHVIVADAGGGVERRRQLNATQDADFYVANIELLRTDMYAWFWGLRPQRELSGACNIQTLIVDEAHRLRGRNSQQTEGAKIIAKRVPRVYFLTATPVYNQPNDLYSLMHMLDPTRFPSYYKFCQDYLKIWETPWGPQVLGLKKDKALKSVFAEYALGRTREDVQAQLPALQESLIELTPDDSWYERYENLKRTFRDTHDRQMTSLQAVLQNLRSFTQSAKAQAVCELILDSCAAHTLVYTYHRDLANALGHLLKAQVITGDMPPAQREAIARGCDFLVATFPSIAEGIDLSHMQNVVYVEHTWQPGMMAQSLNRAYRPGNTHAHLNVYHIVVKRTVDQVIYGAYKRRGMTMEEIVEAALVPVPVDAATDDVA